jgi:alkanesulfonate monooxygenase SsuD/methylene tetrahydromethanopterin reductase-like flavin-dependent oxidoreductase (luciferase family)
VTPVHHAAALKQSRPAAVKNRPMHYGLFIPPFDDLADPGTLAHLAARAESAGWDGVFLWDHVLYRPPVSAVADPWIALAAIATVTERVLLGALVTPLARRRPWVVARQAVTLDHLSKGRLVLGAGLGLDSSGGELSRFGEELDDRRRAEMLDEALELIGQLLTGEEVSYHGRHYVVDRVRALPRPYRDRLLPIWLAGRWPNKRPIRRSLRYQGLFLIDTSSVDDVAKAAQMVAREREQTDSFDLVVQGWPDEDPALMEKAGASWWLTRFDPFNLRAGAVEAVIDAGPGRRSSRH